MMNGNPRRLAWRKCRRGARKERSGAGNVTASIDRVSTPGRRVYAKSTELKPVLSGQGIAILSTSAGVMTNKEARRRKLGGEVLCHVS